MMKKTIINKRIVLFFLVLHVLVLEPRVVAAKMGANLQLSPKIIINKTGMEQYFVQGGLLNDLPSEKTGTLPKSLKVISNLDLLNKERLKKLVPGQKVFIRRIDVRNSYDKTGFIIQDDNGQLKVESDFDGKIFEINAVQKLIGDRASRRVKEDGTEVVVLYRYLEVPNVTEKIIQDQGLMSGLLASVNGDRQAALDSLSAEYKKEIDGQIYMDLHSVLDKHWDAPDPMGAPVMSFASDPFSNPNAGQVIIEVEIPLDKVMDIEEELEIQTRNKQIADEKNGHYYGADQVEKILQDKINSSLLTFEYGKDDFLFARCPFLYENEYTTLTDFIPIEYISAIYMPASEELKINEIDQVCGQKEVPIEHRMISDSI